MAPVQGLEIEIGLFGQSFLYGVCLFIGYDMLRIIRRVFSHGIIWVSVEDFFYWLVSGGFFFLRLCQVNNGIIRGYILLGMALGAWVYYRLCSRILMRRLTKIVIRMKKQLKKWREMITIRLEKFRKPEKMEETGEKDESEEKKTP